MKIITRFGGAHLFILTDRRVIAQSYGALENTKVSFLNLTIPIIVLPTVYCFGKINGPLCRKLDTISNVVRGDCIKENVTISFQSCGHLDIHICIIIWISYLSTKPCFHSNSRPLLCCVYILYVILKVFIAIFFPYTKLTFTSRG